MTDIYKVLQNETLYLYEFSLFNVTRKLQKDKKKKYQLDSLQIYAI